MSDKVPTYFLRTDYDGSWFAVDANGQPVNPENVDSVMFLAIENAQKVKKLKTILKNMLENCPVCRGQGTTQERCYGECIETVLSVRSPLFETEMMKHKTHNTGNLLPCRHCGSARVAIKLL